MKFAIIILVLAPLVLAEPFRDGSSSDPGPPAPAGSPVKRDVSYTIYRYPYTTAARRYYYSYPESTSSWYYPSDYYRPTYRLADETSSPLSSVVMKPSSPLGYRYGAWREPYDGFYTGERYVSA